MFQSLYAPAYSIISSYANFGEECLGLRIENMDMAAMCGNGDGPGAEELKAELVKSTVELPESFKELFCRWVGRAHLLPCGCRRGS